MIVRCILLAVFCLTLHPRSAAQSEIEWTVRLNTDQILQTDRQVFQTLEKDILQFLNGRTWTDDRFASEERIEATLFLTLAEQDNQGVIVPEVFKGSVALQVVRPVYGTGEVTPTLNYLDESIRFNYAQFDQIQLSDQSYVSELSSLLGFYAYLVLGIDYDTFSPMGGQVFYEQAQEIYNQLPKSVSDQQGWTAAGKRLNRFLLLENLLSPRMIPVRRALYNYHRLGLDLIVVDPLTARKNITLAIEDVQTANQNYPNNALVQAFVDAKRQEIINIYQGATGAEQSSIISMMSRIDPANSGEYRQIRAGANGRQVGRR